MTLDTPVSKIKGVTKKVEGALKALEIEIAKDLLFCLPTRYEDYTSVVPVRVMAPGVQCTVAATVVSSKLRRIPGRRLSILEATISDASGEATAIWYNQPWIANRLRAGERYRFAGKPAATKFGLRLANPIIENADGAANVAERVVPVYPLAAGLSQRVMRRIISAALAAADPLVDPVPARILEENDLLGLRDAVMFAHVPQTMDHARRASRRLAFDELFRIQLAIGRLRRGRQERTAVAIPFDEAMTKSFVASLPYQLTEDQRLAAWEIIGDIGRDTPMHRLLDGDVGSGKTVVAAIAAANCVTAGYQAAFMAPTEILARQHYETLRKLYAETPFTLALWTGAYKRSSARGVEIFTAGKKERDALGGRIESGGIGVVVGTHALVEDGLRFSNLALAVVDEQHRFGVGARKALTEKSGMPGVEPHLLSLTATPIPRSLALVMYGDLDVSLLKTKPGGRKPVVTKLFAPARRREAYALMRREIDAGRQAFVVCPLIDPSDTLGATSVGEERERLASVFPEVTIAALHGRMPQAEREAAMAGFVNGTVKILVSTSVIEVGVDVPNASVMLIEGAERFGLAQLHQFRGRVGRGAVQSYCILLPSEFSPAARERLEIIASTDDGFSLAERDLMLRGPGDVLGESQSGYSRLALASLTDVKLVRAAQDAAAATIKDDPDLSHHPELAKWVGRLSSRAHLE